jgi:hypothetical protein
MNTNEKVPFRLSDIITEQFAIINEDADNFETDSQFNLEVGYGLNKEDSMLKTSMKATFQSHNKPIVILKISCVFKIEEKAFESFKRPNESFEFPMGLLRHLCVLTTGTLRGVLHAKLEGQKSSLSKLILPTINVNELVKEDIIFHKEEVQ